MAITTYTGYDLLQNIIASRPSDFAKYGVYTCRFYVEGQWVDVLTDTKLPCVRDQRTGLFSSVYSRSRNSVSELWIPLIEKAYAKALGSYEAVTKIKIHDAFLHLTGGSVQQMYLHDETTGELKVEGAWKLFKSYLNNNAIITAQPSQFALEGLNKGKLDNNDVQNNEILDDDNKAVVDDEEFEEKKEIQGFLPNRLYSLISCHDIGGFELVLMHNPWSENCWGGEWSDGSSDWGTYPEILAHIREDKSILWTLENPRGFFWMTFKNFQKYFNSIYVCKLFPSHQFNYYCIKGEWKDQSAGGMLQTIKDEKEVKLLAKESHDHALQKATAEVIVDGDVMWFNNPQYNITCNIPTLVYISLMPIGQTDNDSAPIAYINVIKTSRSILEPHIIDSASFQKVEKEGYIDGIGKSRGQEVSIFAMQLDPRCCYHLIPNTHKRNQWSSFVLRIFSRDNPLIVNALPSLHSKMISGEWRRAGDLDTTGGPPMILNEQNTGKKINSKWCQNPQYHVNIANSYGKDELHLKITLKRSDKTHGGGGGGGATNKIPGQVGLGNLDKNEAMIGLVICKANIVDEKPNASKRGKPRENALGELMPSKESTLKLKYRHKHIDEAAELEENITPLPGKGIKNEDGKIVLRQQSIATGYSQLSSFSHKSDAAIYYPKIPRSWMPEGLIIIPCLSEKGVRGTFDLEVFCSEEIKLTQLPDAYSRVIAGEWTEATAGGSHICHGTWKKNSKFNLKLRGRSISSTRVTISVTRQGESWKHLCRTDTVGCMLGFYIFTHRPNPNAPGGLGELHLFYESPFVPAFEVITDSSFTLPPLENEEEYCIMPTTFAEAKIGSYVLSVLAECEFTLAHVKQ